MLQSASFQMSRIDSHQAACPSESGVAIGATMLPETFGNPTGGFKQGATYDGVLELHLNADLKKLGLWKGL
jgi:porin